jgi:His Kinase A (phospho-acceptor) domain
MNLDPSVIRAKAGGEVVVAQERVVNEEQSLELVTATTSDGTNEPSEQLTELFVRVASAIAHDLNNTLMVISSNCELLLDSMPPEDPRQKYAQRIQNATRRAVRIGDSLLVFSRSHATPTEPVEFDSALAELIPIMKGIAGKQRTITYSVGSGVKTVCLARGLVTQVILATFAAVCSKVASSQCVEVHTGLLRWTDTDTAPPLILTKGDYVWISVAESVANAAGLSPDPWPTELETLENRLTSVRNLVRSCGGQIAVHVDSVEAMVTVYLPRFDFAAYQHDIPTGAVIGAADTPTNLPC